MQNYNFGFRTSSWESRLSFCVGFVAVAFTSFLIIAPSFIKEDCYIKAEFISRFLANTFGPERSILVDKNESEDFQVCLTMTSSRLVFERIAPTTESIYLSLVSVLLYRMFFMT